MPTGLHLQYEMSETAPATPAMELVAMIEPPGLVFSVEVTLIAWPPYLIARKVDRCKTEATLS